MNSLKYLRFKSVEKRSLKRCDVINVFISTHVFISSKVTELGFMVVLKAFKFQVISFFKQI